MSHEKKVVKIMIAIFCRDHHSENKSFVKTEGEFCGECGELFEYAMRRLNQCPYQEKKPSCEQCKIHCYEPAMREKIRKVMKFSGPKMIFKHPVLAITHLKDKLKNRSAHSVKKQK